MFATTEPAVVEQKCKEQGFEVTWDREVDGAKGGTVKLVHTMNATRTHPETGDIIWHNHMNVLHIDSETAEFAFSAQHLQSWWNLLVHLSHEVLVQAQRFYFGGDEELFGHHSTHADGEPMLLRDVDYVSVLTG